jgi:hypothetical protein
VACRTRTTKL